VLAGTRQSLAVVLSQAISDNDSAAIDAAQLLQQSDAFVAGIELVEKRLAPAVADTVSAFARNSYALSQVLTRQRSTLRRAAATFLRVNGDSLESTSHAFIKERRSPRLVDWPVILITANEFVLRLLYTAAYVFVGGAIAALVVWLLSSAGIRGTVEKVVDQFALDRGKAAALWWSILAPVGLAAGVATSFASSATAASATRSVASTPEKPIAPPVILVRDSATLQGLASAMKDLSSQLKRVDSISDATLSSSLTVLKKSDSILGVAR
jgi:hypothetical protein